MPSPNKSLGTPSNTHGDKIPVGVQYLGDPHIPTYWGDEQIMSEAGVYSKPKLPDNVPLHIPRVVRFLYGYGNPSTPPELNWTGCGCTTLDTCPDKICTWELLWKRYEVSYVVNPSFYLTGFTAQQTGGFQGWHAYPNIGTYPDGAAAGSTLKIWNNESDYLAGNPPDYDGPLDGAPGIDKVYVYDTRWELKCVDRDTGEPVDPPDGCHTTASSTYAVSGGSPNPALTCNMSGHMLTSIHFGTTYGTSLYGLNPTHENWNIFTVNRFASALRNDYPVPSDWDGMCIEDEYPC